jgi:hypothetical protein
MFKDGDVVLYLLNKQTLVILRGSCAKVLHMDCEKPRMGQHTWEHGDALQLMLLGVEETASGDKLKALSFRVLGKCTHRGK